MNKLLLALALTGTSLFSASAADWYLVGANFGWNDNPTYQFTPSADDANIQTLQVAELAGTIKIKEAGTWDTSFGTNGTKLIEGTTYNASTNGGDISIDGIIKNATITIDVNAHTILATGETAENEYDTVYVVGDFGSDWSETNTNYPMTLKEGTENVWQGSFTFSAAPSYFKLKAGQNVYGPTGYDDVAVENGVSYETTTGAQKTFMIPAGTYNFTYTLDKNAPGGTLVVSVPGSDNVVYIFGNVEGEEVTEGEYAGYGFFRAPLAETAESGVFEGKVTFTNVDEMTPYGVAMILKDNASYGLTEDMIPESGVTYEIIADGSAMYVPKGIYNVKVDMNAMQITLVDETPRTEYYLRGDINGWEVSEEYKFTQDRSGVYTLTIPTLSGAFKISDADWTAENSFSTANAEMVPEEEYELSSDVDVPVNPNMGVKGNYKDVTVLFSPEYRLFLFEGTPADEPQPAKTVIINGSINGGDANEPNSIELSEGEEAGIYETTMTVNPAFPAIDEETGDINMYPGIFTIEYDDKFFTVEEGMAFTYGTNPLIECEYGEFVMTNPATYKVRLDMNAMTLEMTDVTEYPELYLRGEVSGWNADEAYRLEMWDSGIFGLNTDKLSGPFKIASDDWTIALTTGDSKMENGAPYQFVNSGDNMAMAEKLVNVEVVVYYNYNIIVVGGEPDETPVVTTYSLEGAFGADGAWTAVEMTKAEDSDIYTAEAEVENVAGNFLVKELADGIATAYWKAAEGTILDANNQSITLSANAGFDAYYDFTGLEGKKVTFFFNPTTGELTATWTTGIEGLAADEADAQYFNLQGVRIDRPEKGLCIRVQNGKATRVLVK